MPISRKAAQEATERLEKLSVNVPVTPDKPGEEEEDDNSLSKKDIEKLRMTIRTNGEVECPKVRYVQISSFCTENLCMCMC